MTDSSSEIRRLVLAKNLYLHGCNIASTDDTVSRLLAVHHFDNAVEIVLKCVATEYGVVDSARDEYRFKDLWNEVDGAVEENKGWNLPMKQQIFSLHDLRNIAQHQGEVPSSESVRRHMGFVESFFQDMCHEVFEISLDELYLSQLIEHQEVREAIQTAEEAYEEEEYERCIRKADDALIMAVFDISDIIGKAGQLTGYWGADDAFERVIDDEYSESYEGDLGEIAEDLSNAIQQLGQATAAMQFLDEYRTDFIQLRQRIAIMDVGNELDNPQEGARHTLNFVTELILKWESEGLFNRTSE